MAISGVCGQVRSQRSVPKSEQPLLFKPAPLPTAELSEDERLACLRLIRSENVGPVTFRELINHFGGAANAIAATPGAFAARRVRAANTSLRKSRRREGTRGSAARCRRFPCSRLNLTIPRCSRASRHHRRCFTSKVVANFSIVRPLPSSVRDNVRPQACN